jgi:hypothetical protein
METTTVVTFLSISVIIISVISLIITAIYSNKRGHVDGLSDEKEFLNFINTYTPVVVTPTA